MIQDRVDRDGGLSGLSVSDDQFALAASDRGHRVDRFDAGLHRLGHRLSLGDTGGDDFNGAGDVGLNRAFTVQRVAQRVQYTADDGIAGRNTQKGAECLDFVSFLNRQIVSEDDDADAVFFQVKRQSDGAVGELNHFAGHDARQTINAGDPVTDFQYGTDFADVDLAVEVLDLLLQDRCDFVTAKFHGNLMRQSFLI